MSRFKAILESRRTEAAITVAILLNALVLGLETHSSWSSTTDAALHWVDIGFLLFFTAEIGAKLAVYRLQFFRNPWNLFDMAVIGISWIPSSGPLSVLRALRVLRTLRLVSVIPSLRRVIQGILGALPGLTSIVMLMSLLFYIGAVISTKLFSEAFPDWFGNLWKSAYTLFQVMTLESWSMGIVRPVMERFPYAWLFFIPFIGLATFTMLNLFIGVIVNAMQAEGMEQSAAQAKQSQDEREIMLEEIRALRKQVERLEGYLAPRK